MSCDDCIKIDGEIKYYCEHCWSNIYHWCAQGHRYRSH